MWALLFCFYSELVLSTLVLNKASKLPAALALVAQAQVAVGARVSPRRDAGPCASGPVTILQVGPKCWSQRWVSQEQPPPRAGGSLLPSPVWPCTSIA